MESLRIGLTKTISVEHAKTFCLEALGAGSLPRQKHSPKHLGQGLRVSELSRSLCGIMQAAEAQRPLAFYLSLWLELLQLFGLGPRKLGRCRRLRVPSRKSLSTSWSSAAADDCSRLAKPSGDCCACITSKPCFSSLVIQRCSRTTGSHRFPRFRG